MQGQRDTDLNPLGRVQAEEAGARLRGIVRDCEALDYVASPLKRTRETMEALRKAIGLEPTSYRLDDRLKELSFGSWEGLTWREVRARDARAAAARERDKWNYVPPEGESYAMLKVRVAPLVGEIAQDCVVVAHGGVARVLLALLAGVPEREAPLVDIWQGRVLVFESGTYRWV